MPVTLCLAQEHAADHGHETHAADAHGDAGQHDSDHHDNGSHGDSGHGDASHGSGHHGRPPIAQDEAIWGMVAFIGFVLAIHKLGLWRSLKTNMARREQNEIDVIAAAESKLSSAQSALSKYRGQLEAMDETVAETLAEAKRDASHTQADIVNSANKEAGLMVQRAEHEIERSKDQALNRLFEHMSKRVAETAEAKFRSQLQSQDQDRLIDDTLSQLAAN